MNSFNISFDLYGIRFHINIFVFFLIIIFAIVGIFNTFVHLYLFLGIIALILIHEIGHFVMARLNAIESKDIYILPFIGFCTVGDITYNYQQIAVYSGGILFQVFAFVTIFFVQKVFHNNQVLYQYFDTLLLVNTGTIILNLIPVKPFDGYFIFTSVITSVKNKVNNKNKNILKFKKRYFLKR